MKEINCIDVLNELNDKEKEVHRAYLLFGEGNEYLKYQIVDKIKQRVLSPGLEGFDFGTFNGETLNINEFEGYLISPPFGNKKVVLLEAGNKLKKEDLKYVLSLKVPDFSVLIFESESKETPLLMENDAIFVKDYSVKQSTTEDWIRLKFKENGKEVSQEAVKEIFARLDTDYYLLDSEITKLSLYVGSKKKVELKDVIDVVNYIPDIKIYNFINAMLTRKREQAIQIYSTMVQEYKVFQDNMLLSLLIREFSKLLMMKDFNEHGIRDSETISNAFKNVFETDIKKQTLVNMSRNIENFSFKELLDKYSKLVEIDVKSKSGEIDLPTALRLFIQTD
jgi:DNA polymerase-3 subunit delta